MMIVIMMMMVDMDIMLTLWVTGGMIIRMMNMFLAVMMR